MPRLKRAERKRLPKNAFALPGKRKFPVDTRARAANAKARATQGVNKGTLTKAEKAKIFAKANKVLRRKK